MKNQKPIEIQAHLRYKCPDINCGLDHWISLKEAKTKGFKIVCDCSIVFSPRLVADLLVRYQKKKKDTIKPKLEQHNIIPTDLLKKSSSIMQTFGFTRAEAESKLTEFYSKNPIQDYKELIQNTLANKE